MAQGQNNRAVGSHDMNEHSSRSHSILTIACRWVQRERERKETERDRERGSWRVFFAPALPNFILSLFPLIPFSLPWLPSSFSSFLPSFLSLTFLPSFLPVSYFSSCLPSFPPSFLPSFIFPLSSFFSSFFLFRLYSLIFHPFLDYSPCVAFFYYIIVEVRI